MYQCSAKYRGYILRVLRFSPLGDGGGIEGGDSSKVFVKGSKCIMMLLSHNIFYLGVPTPFIEEDTIINLVDEFGAFQSIYRPFPIDLPTISNRFANKSFVAYHVAYCATWAQHVFVHRLTYT